MTQPPKRQTVTAATTEKLRQLILSGELNAGESLRQDELSSRLGVSRTPLREAIITLQAEGLVVTHPHKGALVYKPTAAELEEIYEIRMLLETHAARLATERMRPEVLRECEGIVQSMASAAHSLELVRLNHAFRQAFYAASGRPYLVDMIRSLTLRAEPYVGMLMGGPRRAFIPEELGVLLQAIRAGNAEEAARITRGQLEATVANVLPMLAR